MHHGCGLPPNTPQHLPQIVSRPPEFWLVPMSLPLSALRDALYCVTDVNINNMNPQASSKNSYFYIEGAFFLDTRHTEGFEDYSQPLREFCKKHRIAAPADAAEVYPAGVGVDAMGFGVGSMERVCFGDLVLQVNSPRFNYYFCHQVYGVVGVPLCVCVLWGLSRGVCMYKVVAWYIMRNRGA